CITIDFLPLGGQESRKITCISPPVVPLSARQCGVSWLLRLSLKPSLLVRRANPTSPEGLWYPVFKRKSRTNAPDLPCSTSDSRKSQHSTPAAAALNNTVSSRVQQRVHNERTDLCCTVW
ncbi:unnamed protein product, partial [Ectocarpus sp. 12 AP-2014]